MPEEGSAQRIRLAELLGALSLGIDLGFGQPMEHVLRQCLISLRLAERLGLDSQARRDVYFAALCINVGCHADAHEQAKWFGDDIAIKAAKFEHGMRGRGVWKAMQMLGGNLPPLHRFRLGLEFMISGHREMDVTLHLKVAVALTDRLGLPASVRESLEAAYEAWDGRGYPGKLSKEDIPLPARIAQIAEYVEVANRVGGVPSVASLCGSLAGSQFDPGLAKLLVSEGSELLAGLDAVQTWTAVIDAEGALAGGPAAAPIDDAIAAVAEFIDLKSPYFLGHSANVAELAAAAGRRLGLPAADVRALRRAALVHNFGRLGVSNAIWDKVGPLGAGEWERVRMHPYLTERMVRQSPGLTPIGSLAAQHCERMDGSGYPHGLRGAAIPLAARLLGAAVAYQAMCEPRPHRPARSPELAATELRSDVRAGRHDGDAVEAVLAAAGHRSRRSPEQPAGLTPREVEVLRLVARGMSTKDAATTLGIAPKTAGNHIERIYAKIGVKNRAEAGLFAVQNGLFSLEISDTVMKSDVA
jgi:HD-GYP domain-containing protein (c-di-GMP phosphodiesterase class II)